ncbi:MAG: zinc ABC transporter substrate-binding protein [Patescibacteria group bacterium]
MKTHVVSLISVIFFLGILGVVIWLGAPDTKSVPRENRLFVVTTLYPLEELIRQVGGEYVYVANLIPPGAEPHDYEPTPRDVTDLLQADVLVYLGGGLDAWAEDLAPDVMAAGGLTLGIETVVPFYELSGGEVEVVADDHEHEHGNIDPHIWLDPVLMQQAIEGIRSTLTSADPVRAQIYAANAEAYTLKLMDLADEYTAALAQCQLNDIIAAHDAFGYLSRRYNFNLHSIAGMSPDAEPSVKDLTALARTARSLGVKTIFFETLVSPELAQTLAKEIGAETAVLNPLEGLTEEELANSEDYLSVMRTNLEALSAAMLCR